MGGNRKRKQQFSPHHSQRRAYALPRGLRRSFAHYLALSSSGMGRAGSYAGINHTPPFLMAELLQNMPDSGPKAAIRQDVRILPSAFYCAKGDTFREVLLHKRIHNGYRQNTDHRDGHTHRCGRNGRQVRSLSDNRVRGQKLDLLDHTV